MSRPNLTLKAGLDRSKAWRRGGSVRYVVAEIAADRPARRAAPPKALNLALVIDASGSMSGPKLLSAKQAACDVIRSLGARDLLTVVSFADDVQVHLDAVSCADGQTDRAVRMVEELETRGSTNLAGGWLTGAERVALAMGEDNERVNRVVLLSDGLANVGVTDPATLAEHAAQLRLRGIATSAVGIGDDYSAPLLQSLAEHGGGGMHDAERPEEIGEVLLGELRDSQAVAAQNVTLALQTPPGVVAELVGFYPTLSGPGSLSAELGDLVAGRSRQSVFRLKLPDGAPGSRLAIRLSATGKAPGTDKAIEATPVEFVIELVHGSENSAQPRDDRLAVIAGQAWHAVAVRTVARLNRDGDRRKASGYLERELRHLQRHAKGLPQLEPLLRELVLLLRHVGEVWNERTRKEMEIASYKAARSEPDYRAAPRPHWSEGMERG